jgi:hypothetical protein
VRNSQFPNYTIIFDGRIALQTVAAGKAIFFFTGSTAPVGPGLCFHFHDHFTDSRTPWTSDQLVARPLSKHRTTQTQNKHIHTPTIHALCGIRTHDPRFRGSEDSSCLRQLSYRDRPTAIYAWKLLCTKYRERLSIEFSTVLSCKLFIKIIISSNIMFQTTIKVTI